jgi:soluble lytic murein transglycosylase-like protein
VNIKIAIASGMIIASLGLYLLACLVFDRYTMAYPHSDAEPVVEPGPMMPNNGRNMDTCSLSTRYPQEVRRWCTLIDKYASQNGMQPELVAAVILQESGGDPNAYSTSGAVGLMQIMPRDGIAAGFQCANGPCFASRPTMQELFDPEFNISFGSKMLAGLLGSTGELTSALAAYGPIDSGSRYAAKVIAIMEEY